MVCISGQPIQDEFEIAANQREQVDHLIGQVRRTLNHSSEDEQDVILSALAHVTAEYLESRGSNDTRGVEGSVA